MVARCSGFFKRPSILVKTRRFVFVPLLMIGHVLTCVWLISHFVALFSPYFICLSLLSDQHGINEHERSSRLGNVVGSLQRWFHWFSSQCILAIVVSFTRKSVANVFLLQLRTWSSRMCMSLSKALSYLIIVVRTLFLAVKVSLHVNPFFNVSNMLRN